MSNVEIFVDRFVRLMPEVQGIRDEHVLDNDELLPHVFMGDITRFAVQLAGSPTEHDVLRRMLSLVEEGLGAEDEHIQNLMAVSFVENLCGEDESIEILFPMMGPRTRSQLIDFYS